MGRVDEAAFSAAFGPLFLGKSPVECAGVCRVVYADGKEVQSLLSAPRLTSLGVDQDFWKVADTSSIL